MFSPCVQCFSVLKTRAQTDPRTLNGEGANSGSVNLIDSGIKIIEREGVGALLLGTQATIVGYFWYGLSVYPCYTFFKRFLSQTLDANSLVAVAQHGNEIALLAGAMAAVVASLGLSPIEAARIRAVANPAVYRPLGLVGTLQVIATEDATLGWKNLYAGLPSLLTRQVLFGSIKFLAFERACEFIFAAWPFLLNATWTTLAVSLVAGGWSGVISSAFSQPADSVLTYVSKEGSVNIGGKMNLLDGVQQMIANDGPSSLFRGLGSRCVWAGCIIAGQFLLYDIFRTVFGVSADDLSQVFQVHLTR
jgi:solute carrier family 25 (mitochondrial phosphate transporter), member 3